MSRVVVNEIEAKVGNDITFNDTVKIDTIKGKTTAGSVTVQGEGTATTNLQQGLAKSFIRWENLSTASVLGSFNHSSFVDNGTGDNTITVTSAFSNVNYVHTGMGGGGNTNLAFIQQCESHVAATTTAARYQSGYANSNLYDWGCLNVTLHGDLA